MVKTIRAMKLHTMIGLEAEVNLKKIPRITTMEANLQISAQMVCIKNNGGLFWYRSERRLSKASCPKATKCAIKHGSK